MQLRISTVIILILLSTSLIVQAQKRERGNRHRRSQVSNTMIDKKAATDVFIDGIKAKILGETDKSMSLFKRCLEIDPGNDAAMYELSQIYFAQNDFTTSSSLIEKAIEIDPENQYYRLLSLDIYGKSGRKEDLLKSCQQLVKLHPENVDYKFELATAYLMMGKGEDATEVYDAIEEVIGITEEVSLQKQRIYLLLNKPEKAESEIRKLIDTYPEESGRYYSMLAELYMQLNKPDVAATYYEKILQVDPENPYVHISLADYYRKKGDQQRSFEELKSGLSNPALDVDTKIRILMTYYTPKEIYEDKKSETLELSELILKSHPNDPKAISLQADLLLNDKKYDQALVLYRQVLAKDSSRYAVWENFLQAETSLMDWKSLVTDSERAMDLFPFQPLPYLFSGIASLQIQDAENAIRVLNSGVKLVTDNQNLLIQFYSTLGDAYNQVKKSDLSDQSYEKALKLDPNNSYVLNNYSYFLSLRGKDLDKALEMAKRGAILDSLNPANLDTYGWVLYKNGQYDQAKIWVGKALIVSPKEDADILEHYGDILFKLGDVEMAVDYWNKAKKAGKGSEYLERKVNEKRLIE